MKELRPAEKVCLVCNWFTADEEKFLLHMIGFLVEEGYISLVEKDRKVKASVTKKDQLDLRDYEKALLDNIQKENIFRFENYYFSELKKYLQSKGYYKGLLIVRPTKKTKEFRKNNKLHDFGEPGNKLIKKFVSQIRVNRLFPDIANLQNDIDY